MELSYKITYRPQFEKSIKKIAKTNPQLANDIFDLADKIQLEPSSYPSLKGNLSTFKSVHFHRNPEYRILFKIYECHKESKNNIHECLLHEITLDSEPQNCKGLIDFVFVETRETFNRLYKLSKKELLNFIY